MGMSLSMDAIVLDIWMHNIDWEEVVFWEQTQHTQQVLTLIFYICLSFINQRVGRYLHSALVLYNPLERVQI